MKTTIGGLIAVVSVLTSASLSTARPGPEVCPPGQRGCAPERRGEEPRVVGSENHPCDWVETCQLPCSREGDACCHAEWDCPPDSNMPRC